MKPTTLVMGAVWAAALYWTVQEYSREMPSTTSGMVVASLASKSGELWVREPMASGWLPVEKSRSFTAGSVVSTGKESKAVLKLQSGRELKMAAESQLLLEVANAQNDPVVTVVEGSMTVTKKAAPQKSTFLNQIFATLQESVAPKENLVIATGDKEIRLAEADAESELGEAEPQIVAATPEPTPEPTAVATAEPTPPPLTPAQIMAKRKAELDSWVLEFPYEKANLWNYSDKTRARPLKIRYGRRSPVPESSRPPVLAVAESGKTVQKIEPAGYGEKTLEYEIPSAILFKNSSHIASVEIRLEDPPNTEHFVASNRSGAFSLTLASLLPESAYEVSAKAWAPPKTQRGWVFNKSTEETLAPKITVRNRESALALLKSGVLPAPFSLKAVESFPETGTFLVKNESVWASVPTEDATPEWLAIFPEVFGARLVFEGSEKWLFTAAETTEARSGVLPSRISATTGLWGYRGEKSFGLKASSYTRWPTLLAPFSKYSELIFTESPRVLWDTVLKRAPNTTTGPEIPSPLPALKPHEVKTTALVFRKNEGVVFPTLPEIKLEHKKFLRLVESDEIRLNLSINGQQTEQSLRKNPRNAFLFLEKMLGTELLVAIMEQNSEHTVALVGRDEKRALTVRSKVWKGSLPENWFEEILGFNTFVSGSTKEWLFSSNSQRPCAAGEQGVVMARPGRSVFLPTSENPTPKALVECVQSTDGTNVYKILLGSSAFAAPLARAILPE
jgi:hypothetical protein